MFKFSSLLLSLIGGLSSTFSASSGIIGLVKEFSVLFHFISSSIKNLTNSFKSRDLVKKDKENR